MDPLITFVKNINIGENCECCIKVNMYIDKTLSLDVNISDIGNENSSQYYHEVDLHCSSDEEIHETFEELRHFVTSGTSNICKAIYDTLVDIEEKIQEIFSISVEPEYCAPLILSMSSVEVNLNQHICISYSL